MTAYLHKTHETGDDSGPRVTAPGRELADKLLPYLGMTRQILQTCSLIARHGRTHGRLMELQCHRELTPREQSKEAWLEDRIEHLAGLLPHTDAGPIVARCSGDPRGYTVKLILPLCLRAYDTWGGPEDGLGVPNS